MRFRLLALFLIPALSLAETSEEPPPPPKSVLQTALTWMQSSDPERRQAAYRSVHLIGEQALPGFKQALQAALKYHEGRLNELLQDRSHGGNPYRKLGTLLEDLGTERTRVNALIHTDYKKAPEKIRMLRNEVQQVTQIYKKAERLATADPAALDSSVDSIALALVEIHAELQRFERHHAGASTPEDEQPLADQKLVVLQETFDGDLYLKNKKRAAAFRKQLDALAKAESDNKDCAWANASQKNFAKLLNAERAVMGLPPLRLEERLSAAASDHSKDMRSLGFFSHTSPVKGKASPNDRARKAGFQGRWTGENIYMGSASPASAFGAWFGSDGHRFIMFANGPNRLGIGPVGSHWTMMTGRQ